MRKNVNIFFSYSLQELDRTRNSKVLSIISLFLEYGADVEKLNNYDETPLILAVKLNNLPLVHLLLQYG